MSIKIQFSQNASLEEIKSFFALHCEYNIFVVAMKYSEGTPYTEFELMKKLVPNPPTKKAV